MKPLLLLLFVGAAATLAPAQNPRFEDYPVSNVFKGRPTPPVLAMPEELKFAAVIRDGVNKGWGVFNGTTGKEFNHPGPNFAGHYILVSFGCGAAVPTGCFSAAIVDARTGRIYRAASPDPDSEVTPPYFGMLLRRLPSRGHLSVSFHKFDVKPPLAYRLDSRLLVADICEEVFLGSESFFGDIPQDCGAHYYLMENDGLKLIRRVVSDPPLEPGVVVNSR